MWLVLASCLSCLIFLNKYASYPWERCAQFMITGIYLEYTCNHILQVFILAPFLWYILAGGLIEVSHFLHTRKYKDMRENWIKLQILRERADVDALFKVLLQKDTIDKKYLGFQWKKVLEEEF